MESSQAQVGIAACFSELEDPRRHNVVHRFPDIMAIAICAAVSAADGWEDVEPFGRTIEKWLRAFLELPSGIAFWARCACPNIVHARA